MPDIDGYPVRNKTLAEKILSNQSDLCKEYEEQQIAKGVPEEIAKALADEMKLFNRQMLLGRRTDERPAYYPKDKWEKSE